MRQREHLTPYGNKPMVTPIVSAGIGDIKELIDDLKQALD